MSLLFFLHFSKRVWITLTMIAILSSCIYIVWTTRHLLNISNQQQNGATGDYQKDWNRIQLGESSSQSNHFSSFSSVEESFFGCIPTNHACEGYHGVLHIRSGDWGGASGTIFFQFIIAQLMYAEEYNFLPFIHLDNFSHLVYDPIVHGRIQQQDGQNNTSFPKRPFFLRNGLQVSTSHDIRWPQRAKYPGPPKLQPQQQQQQKTNDPPMVPPGDGVWNHYFYPVSDYCPGDQSCQNKFYLTMEDEQISPGLHVYAPWSPKIWRYEQLPPYLAQPHLSLTQWLTPQRQRASDIVKRYYRFRPLITNDNRPHGNKSHFCLGLHVRWSDKGGTRRLLGLEEFLPYVQAYLDQFVVATTTTTTGTQEQPCILLATDAHAVVQQVHDSWPQSMQPFLQISNVIRSSDRTPVFELDSHHRTNTEVLRDIYELSQCQFLLHGKSAVSESAIYLNPTLMYQSVNLEDPTHDSTSQFGSLVQQVLVGNITSDYWRTAYQPPKDWWDVPHTRRDNIRRPSDPVTCFDTMNMFAEQKSGIDNKDIIGTIENHSVQLLNITMEFSPHKDNPYSISMNQWMTRIFVDLPNLLLYAEEHELHAWLDDTSWTKWFEELSSIDAAATDVLNGKERKQSTSKVTCNVSVLHSESVSPIQRILPSRWYFQSISNKKKQNQNTNQRGKNEDTTSSFTAWFQGIRSQANTNLQKYVRIRPHIVDHAKTLVSSSSSSKCLGIHIPDPGYGRQKQTKEWIRKTYKKQIYQSYVEAYRLGGGSCVYLSTPSFSIWEEFSKEILKIGRNENSTTRILAANSKLVPDDTRYHPTPNTFLQSTRWMVHGQSNPVRNHVITPAHYMEETLDRIGSEILVDVWNLANVCEILIHWSNVVSDAALFWNPNMESIHVQDPNRMSPEDLTKRVMELERQ